MHYYIVLMKYHYGACDDAEMNMHNFTKYEKFIQDTSKMSIHSLSSFIQTFIVTHSHPFLLMKFCLGKLVFNWNWMFSLALYLCMLLIMILPACQQESACFSARIWSPLFATFKCHLFTLNQCLMLRNSEFKCNVH